MSREAGIKARGQGAGSSGQVITVVAGVLRDGTGRILLAERLPGKHLAGTWEFPGGKCEPGESAHVALARELAEELGIEIADSVPLLSLTHAYPEKTVHLCLRAVAGWRNEPHGREGQALRWVGLDAMPVLPMPEADRPIARVLGLDPRYSISPDPGDFSDLEMFLSEWKGRLQAGFRLMQLRAHTFDSDALLALGRRCGALAEEYGARWLLNGPLELAQAAGADGVHLTARALRQAVRRPVPESMLLAASCHDVDELRQAGHIGVDFACVSPVQDTASHPGRRSLGWSGLSALCEHSPVPVMALGGLKPDDLEQARACGAFGVAGISGFGAA